MHAFLLVGTQKKTIDEKITEISQKLTAKTRILAISKIDDVREFKKSARFTETQPTLYVIKDLDNATIETSNALLKIIEEPGKNKSIVILTPTLSRILPTIISRAQVIHVGTTQNTAISKNTESFFKNDQSFQLHFVSTLKKREDAICFAREALEYLHAQFVQSPQIKLAHKLELVLTLQQALSAYGNPTIHLTSFIMDINYSDSKVEKTHCNVSKV